MSSVRKLEKAVVCLVGAVILAAFPSWAPAQQAKQPELIARLRPAPELAAARQQMPALRWQRISPPTGSLDGPVLYAIIMRSNATAGNLPKISSTYTLTNSLVSESSGVVSIGGTTSVAAFTMATGAGPGKVLTSDDAGNASWQSPLSVSITAGTGLTSAPSPIAGTGTISIANGGVGNTQLASNAVQSGNIASGQVVKNLNGLFDGITLAAGSNVTITPSGQTLTIAAASGAAPLVRTVVVSPVPGNVTASGTALINALAGITTASASNPWLLKIEPGVYDLGSGSLAMQPFVDIEGSGEDVTTITASGNSTITVGTVLGASNAELRLVTVKNTGGTTEATAIANVSASPQLRHVTAVATGGTIQCQAIYNNNSSAVMEHVTALASCADITSGIVNVNGSATVMDDVTATANVGTDNTAIETSTSSGSMERVTAIASGPRVNAGVLNLAASPTMTDVTASASGGNLNNSGVSNQNSNGTGSSPVMTRITAKATGIAGSSNRAIANSPICLPVMTDIIASASGPGNGNFGVENDDTLPTMSNIVSTASGGGVSVGLFNGGSGTIVNSTFSASGASNNYGIQTQALSGGAFTMNISNSQISGSTNSIFTALGGGATIAFRVGASQLAGPVLTGGGNTYVCAGAYSGSFTVLNAACQ